MSFPIEGANPYAYRPAVPSTNSEGVSGQSPGPAPAPGPLSTGALSPLAQGTGPSGASADFRASAGLQPWATILTGKLRADQIVVLIGLIERHHRPLEEVLERARRQAPNQELHPEDKLKLENAARGTNRLGKPLTASQEHTIQRRLSTSLQEPGALIEDAIREFSATNPNMVMLRMFAQRYAPRREQQLAAVKQALSDYPNDTAEQIGARLGYSEARDIACIEQLRQETQPK